MGERGVSVQEDLSIKQFADLVGLSTRTVERYLAADLIPGAYRVSRNGAWRIPRDVREKFGGVVQKRNRRAMA